MRFRGIALAFALAAIAGGCLYAAVLFYFMAKAAVRVNDCSPGFESLQKALLLLLASFYTVLFIL